MTQRDLNPYQPAGELTAEESAAGELSDGRREKPADRDRPVSLLRTAVRWGAVCSISAIPSFVFGLAVTNGQVAGMLAGILLFVLVYTMADYQTARMAWRLHPITRRTLRIAYGTRMTISIIFPIGGYLDVVCGVFSVSIAEFLTGMAFSPMTREGDALGFWSSLLTTLIQGGVLNLVLGVYALLVHAAQLFVRALRR